MSHFVLDCSVTMAWCFEDESCPYADAVLDLCKTEKAHVPTLWTLEVSNVLLMGERNKRISDQDTGSFWRYLMSLPVVMHDFPGLEDGSYIVSNARKWSLTSYDATYLSLALFLQKPLATLDKKLKQAAKKLDLYLDI